jgi:hypothetical protein
VSGAWVSVKEKLFLRGRKAFYKAKSSDWRLQGRATGDLLGKYWLGTAQDEQHILGKYRLEAPVQPGPGRRRQRAKKTKAKQRLGKGKAAPACV